LSDVTAVGQDLGDAEDSKIVNYPASCVKATRTYHLSSSESEGEDKKPPVKLTSTAASQVQSRNRKTLPMSTDYVLVSKSKEFEQRQRKSGSPARPKPTVERGPTGEKQEKVQKEQEEETKGDDKSKRRAAKNLDKTGTPFLMWRVTQGSGDDQKEEGSVSTMVRLLRRIDRSLKEDATFGKIYGGGFECSLEDICLRHELLEGPAETPPKVQATNTPLSRDGVTGPARPTSASTGLGGAASSTGGTLYVNASEQANGLISDIFVLSKSILGLFIPLNGDGAGVHTDLKVVMDRYWGALDQVFRVSPSLSGSFCAASPCPADDHELGVLT
jgi:hypothetical protein